MGWKRYNLDGSIRVRDYESYDAYLKRQQLKLSRWKTKDKIPRRGKGGSKYLSKRIYKFIDEGRIIDPPANVLCLGARLGYEVEAFIHNGYFAIGVDLAYGIDNPYVMYDDFHNLSFPSSCCQIIYTNSMDHTLDMDRMIGEMMRVLSPRGHAIIESKGGDLESKGGKMKSDRYDCVEWHSHRDLIERFIINGLSLKYQYQGRGFTPWGCIYQNPA